MDTLIRLQSAHEALARALATLQSPLLFAARLFVGWQFWKSGWLKLESWSSTLDLFREEYAVPLLSPELAAVVGTAGELVFPALLLLGLWSRVGALGLSAVNVMAVVSYAHVLLEPGFEAAVAQHVLWGCLLIAVAVFGGGRWSADAWLERRVRQRAATAAAAKSRSPG
jgi:putative oxidoreductase